MPTVVISGNDPKGRRPIVVVQGVRYGLVQVITRTSDVKVKGILHPGRPNPAASRRPPIGVTETD
jgi:hypothetical protein